MILTLIIGTLAGALLFYLGVFFDDKFRHQLKPEIDAQ